MSSSPIDPPRPVAPLFPASGAAESLPGASAPGASQPVLGVPRASWGRLLQRGGDEVLLDKSPDRLLLAPVTPRSPAQVTIPGLLRLQPLGQDGRLWEAQVAEVANLEPIMAQLRASGDYRYVGHVYQAAGLAAERLYLGDEVTVIFESSLDAGAIALIVGRHGLDLVKPLRGLANAFIYRLSDRSGGNPLKITNELMGTPGVLSAEPNAMLPTARHYRPSDSLYSYQWYLQNNGGNQLASGAHIDIERAWDVTRGSRAIVVAVLDDGFDLRHPDLQGNGKIVAPKDFKDNDFNPLPGSADENHGTSCAGVAVGEETGNGVVGVAPGCALMPVRTTGYLDDNSVEEMFDWCTDHGAAVISCSWGPSAVYYALTTRQRVAIARAASQGRGGKGCVIIFAAGNANRPVNGTVNERGWPGNAVSGSTEWLAGFAVHPDVLAVAASTSLNRKAAYSNWGAGIDLCAPSNNAPAGIWLPETGAIATPPTVSGPFPGLGVFTTDRLGAAGYSSTDFTGDFGGTSSACPVVAGVAALVLSANPSLTAAQVRQILTETTDKIVDPNPDPQLGNSLGRYDANGYSQWFGYGKVNAAKAVARAKAMAGGGSPAPAPVPVPSPPAPSPVPRPPAPPGSDVAGHWAEEFLRPLMARGILSGMGDGSIQPNGRLTRGQFAALLAKAFNVPFTRPAMQFWDVPASAWAAAAIDRCYRMGFLAGFPDNSFRPSANLTRAQALVALVNGLRLGGGTESLLSRYVDRDRLPPFARSAVATATLRGLVVNYPELGRINGDRDSSRAETAAFVYQALVLTGQLPALNSPYIVNPSGARPNEAIVDPPAVPDPVPTPEPDLGQASGDWLDHWAEPYVSSLVAAGRLDLPSDGNFRPDETLNRAQLAAFLVRVFDPQPKRPAKAFADVPAGFWAAAAIDRAYRGGFLAGVDEQNFGPAQPVTRLTAAIALTSGLDWPPGPDSALAAYDDRETLPTWARGRVAALAARQIVLPYPDVHLFGGDRPLTRGDLAALVQQSLG